MAGLSTLFANFPLLIYNVYVIIYLREDLITAIAIITIITSLRNLLQIFLRIPLGDLSQIIGRKPLIISGHFSYIIALFLLFLANDWVLVLVGTIFIGVGMSCYWPSIFGYLGDVSLDRVGESNGRLFQLSDIGSLLGSILAYFLLKEIEISLKNLFGIIALISIFTLLISVKLLPESLAKENRRIVKSVKSALLDSWLTMIKSLKSVSLTNKLWHVYLFHFILAFIEFMSSVFIPLIIIEKGFTNADVSAIYFLATLLIFWTKPYLGKITDRLRFVPLIMASLLLTSVTLLGYLYLTDFILIVMLNILVNSGVMISYIAANSAVTRRAPSEQRGIALGVFGVYVSLGRTFSTIILGPIWETFGLTGVFIFAPISVIFAIFILWFIIRRNLADDKPTLNNN
ncbi:MAG: MFS transporter [Candidatus Hodarchaeales archaeon]